MRVQVPWLVAWIFCSAIRAASADSTLRLDDCRLESAVVGGSVAARCGSYHVRENRDDPRSKELQLHVAVIPALRLKPAADPLFILSGGPGQAASDFYLGVAPAFARIRRDRDLVVVDQRGTGRSNRLDCTFPDDSDFTELDPQKLQALVRECLARAARRSALLHHQHRRARSRRGARRARLRQSESLRSLLRHARRAALHAALSRPRAQRRSSMAWCPPRSRSGPHVAIEAQHAIDSALHRCARDADCARVFPQIPAQFVALQERLRKEPVTVSIAGSGDGHADGPPSSMLCVLARRGSAAELRRRNSIDAAASDSRSAVAGRAAGAGSAVLARRGRSRAAHRRRHDFTVVCSEDAPRWDQEHVTQAELAKTYMGTAFMSGMRAVCAEWPRGPVDEDFGKPLRSDVQTLLLSGTDDPVTPRRYADQIMKGLQQRQAPGRCRPGSRADRDRLHSAADG